MKLEIKRTYTITYCVQHFEGTEGSMDSEHFGVSYDNIHEVIHVLETARKVHPRNDWIITCNVVTEAT